MKCDKEKVVKEWKDKYQDAKKDKNTIPNFLLLVQNRCWRQPPTRREVTVTAIQCAAKNALYTKTLLLAAYKTRTKDCGVFVPQELYQIVGEDIYKQKLQEQNECVTTITAVAVSGLHNDAVWSNVKINGGTMMLEHYLNKIHTHILSV
eukprot:1386682-Ditylum_brightwellii.AAC.1